MSKLLFMDNSTRYLQLRNKVIIFLFTWVILLYLFSWSEITYELVLSAPSYAILIVYSRALYKIGKELSDMKTFP